MPLWARAVSGLQVEGRPQRSRTDSSTTIVNTVDRNYFETAGVVIERGREFAHTDQPASVVRDPGVRGDPAQARDWIAHGVGCEPAQRPSADSQTRHVARHDGRGDWRGGGAPCRTPVPHAAVWRGRNRSCQFCRGGIDVGGGRAPGMLSARTMGDSRRSFGGAARGVDDFTREPLLPLRPPVESQTNARVRRMATRLETLLRSRVTTSSAPAFNMLAPFDSR